jgi:hypothetical protein
VFYSSYRSNPVYIERVHHYHYNDGFSPWFWFWLMDRNADERAMWAYHHRSEMDSARYQEMLAKDRDLEQRMRVLEQQGVKPDSNFQPQGVDKDLVYKTDDDVKQDKNYEESQGTSGGQILWLIVRIIAGTVLASLIIWLLFFKKWKVHRGH